MLVSAEIRWFWEEPGSAVADWFKDPAVHGCGAGGGKPDPRRDFYVRDPAQRELGIKKRDGKQVDVKGLVTVLWNGLPAGPFAGPVEIWVKWTAPGLTLDPATLVETRKTRWLRKFDTIGAEPREIPLNDEENPESTDEGLPDLGCNVEFTNIEVGGATWSTFAFEAFGKLSTVEHDLRAVAHVLEARRPPSFAGAMLASYPRWLQQCLRTTTPA